MVWPPTGTRSTFTSFMSSICSVDGMLARSPRWQMVTSSIVTMYAVFRADSAPVKLAQTQDLSDFRQAFLGTNCEGKGQCLTLCGVFFYFSCVPCSFFTRRAVSIPR